MQFVNAISELSERARFRTAMTLAVAADALQIFVFPLFSEGALSPADDVLDLVVAAVLVRLVGWHWEFLPAFAAELVPGVDLVPFWTLSVANVYRRWKQNMVTDQTRETTTVIEGEYKSGSPATNPALDFSHSSSQSQYARQRSAHDQLLRSRRHITGVEQRSILIYYRCYSI